ncbi:MAG TPA: hypothetical protein EYP20_04160 [Aigarchaeota archaeon]|nr:hypothetical protein [Aigarchaeota archaeon]
MALGRRRLKPSDMPKHEEVLNIAKKLGELIGYKVLSQLALSPSRMSARS